MSGFRDILQHARAASQPVEFPITQQVPLNGQCRLPQPTRCFHFDWLSDQVLICPTDRTKQLLVPHSSEVARMLDSEILSSKQQFQRKLLRRLRKDCEGPNSSSCDTRSTVHCDMESTVLTPGGTCQENPGVSLTSPVDVRGETRRQANYFSQFFPSWIFSIQLKPSL